MKNNAIGIFDSGIGGLTVANAIKKVMPSENIIYFGDTKHLPYGEKSEKAIKIFSKKIIKFLITKKCKIIIIACNSASSFADKSVLKIAGKTKIFNVIQPTVEEIAKICVDEKVGVIGTKATIKSGIYQKSINTLCKSVKVHSLPTPLLAPMIEEGFIDEKISNTVIENYLSNKKLNNIDHLILACTHYPLIQKEIKMFFKNNINIINSSSIVAQHVKKWLIEKKITRNSSEVSHKFFVSNYTTSFEKSAKFFFQGDIKLKEISIF